MESQEIDYYEILQVPRNADQALIKKQYRKLALMFHPDKNRDSGREEAEAMFKLVAEAYEVLSDSDKREMYDRYGRNGLECGARARGSQSFHSVDPRELFQQFFGGSFFDDDDDDFQFFSRHPSFRGGMSGSQAGFGSRWPGESMFSSNFSQGMGGMGMGMMGMGGFGAMGQSGFFQSMFDDDDMGFSDSGHSFSSTFTSSNGGQARSVKTTTTVQNGQRVTVKETTIRHADGRVEKKTETSSQSLEDDCSNRDSRGSGRNMLRWNS